MSTGGARQLSVYPTRRAVALMAAGAPVSLVLGALAPGFWLAGVAWVLIAAALIGLDAVSGVKAKGLGLVLDAPQALAINARGMAKVAARFAGLAPDQVEMAVETGPKLVVAPVRRQARAAGGTAEATFNLTSLRRGETEIARIWVRWPGRLGLVWKQVEQTSNRKLAVTVDVEGVKQEAVKLFARNAMHGPKMQLDVGEGAEFHALTEFQQGMDTRVIDWKQSARHSQLLAKEYRIERNNPMVVAIDCGRAMCEPVDGLARIDWALNAALRLAYVGLRLGDRVGLYSFDERPRGLNGPVSGVRAYAALQHAAGRLDYSTAETNYTLGLSSLADQLERRSLVVVFTEFTDPTAAQLMIENVSRLLARHLVVFVAMRDDELESLVRAEPVTPDDVSRAVIAQSLLREREQVTARLRRLGVEIVDAPAALLGPALLDRYLEIKRRSRL
jgi:uncharacterized protein (DUF58 family)